MKDMPKWRMCGKVAHCFWDSEASCLCGKHDLKDAGLEVTIAKFETGKRNNESNNPGGKIGVKTSDYCPTCKEINEERWLAQKCPPPPGLKPPSSDSP